MPGPAPTRPVLPLAAALLVAAVLATFGRSAGFPFVLIDDDTNVYANPLVHPAAPEGRFARAWREPYLQLYIPVTYNAWALVAVPALVPEGAEPGPQVVNRLSPRPFHVANLALHALAALLVLAILRTVLSSDPAAALGALFFALHPLQAEPVAWVSGFKDLMGGVLALASVWLYLRHARAAGPVRPVCPVHPGTPDPGVASEAAGRGLRASYWLALSCLALGVLAKPSAVVAPLLAGLLDVLVLRRGWRRALVSLLPFLLLAAAGAVVVAGAQPPDPDLPEVAIWQRPLVALDALGFYAGKLFWPFELAPFYGRTPDAVLAGGPQLPWWPWWVGALGVTALAIAALAARRRSTVPLAALGLFAAALGPALGLVPFTFQVFSTVADRYAYLALLGPALLLAWLARGRPGVLAAGVFLVVLLGVESHGQAGHWRDTERLFLHSLAVFPDSAFVHGNLGEHRAREGDVEGAVRHFREAVRLQPDSAQQRNNLGSYLGQNGRLDEALEQLTEAVRLDPDYARARMGLASTLMGLGRTGEALRELQQVHRIEPDFAPAYLSEAALRWQQGDRRGALDAYEQALRADPALVDVRVQLGGLYLEDGRLQDAIRVLRPAVEQAPEHALARAELGRALLMSNRAVDALPYLEEARRLDPQLGPALQPMIEAARAAPGGADATGGRQQ